ncbi:MAG: Asp-tRNA(Asn)/Glu-tRNA(Gln) amidotransferase subunit GatB [bacterium]|nr:Asp-tRNA(Asn)/Glu-tRNA(Gln) amidotransferase subunit GatB [bacterium]
MSATTWVPVIGLEVHCQLGTQTKLFCGCANRFGAEPNTLTCPVCTGQPGALPVLNQHAFDLALRAALALGCDIAPWSKFDRKNYFYCDLPKGYQISQYDRPYCSGGGITLASGKHVRLTRIHMEEDAGKAVHDAGNTTRVDLNRAGVPLIESVTEADMTSSEEAHAYLVALKEILQYAGVSDCDMEKGSLRCDVNISVHPEDEPWRTKVEIKNLNSFRNVSLAIEHEIGRQIAAYEAGAAIAQETRLFDPDRGETRTMRSKENEADYRYFPEPDLPPIPVDAALLERERGLLPEPAAERRARYRTELGLSEYDAGVLTSERGVADFFEAAVRASHDGTAKDLTNLITNELLAGLAGDEIEASTIAELPCKPHQLAELVALTQDGTITKKAARSVVREMMKTGRSPAELVRELGLEQVQDTGQIEAWCRSALEAKPQVIDAVRGGNDKAIGACMGAVMQASGGSANPEAVRDTLLRLIRESD